MLLRIPIALAAVAAAWGEPLCFEVASVKIAAPCCAPGQWPNNRPGVDRINFRNASLWYSLTYAYGVKSYQLFGPDWLRDVRFDIVAKGREGTRREQLPEMMQNLLSERLGVRVHREKREIDGLVLMVGKDGPRLKEASAESGDGQGGAQVRMSMSADGVDRMDVKGGTMATLINTLTGLLGRPVVDQTGLGGRYDFVLEFSRGDTAGARASGGYNEPPAFPPSPPGSAPGLSIYSSIRQLGLRLDARKIPMDVVVVDRAERAPAEN